MHKIIQIIKTLADQALFEAPEKGLGKSQNALRYDEDRPDPITVAAQIYGYYKRVGKPIEVRREIYRQSLSIATRVLKGRSNIPLQEAIDKVELARMKRRGAKLPSSKPSADLQGPMLTGAFKVLRRLQNDFYDSEGRMYKNDMTLGASKMTQLILRDPDDRTIERDYLTHMTGLHESVDYGYFIDKHSFDLRGEKSALIGEACLLEPTLEQAQADTPSYVRTQTLVY